MSNTIDNLNNVLFNTLARLSDPTLDATALEAERGRANAIKGIADTLLRSADTQLRFMQSLSQSIPVNTQIPEMFRLESTNV